MCMLVIGDLEILTDVITHGIKIIFSGRFTAVDTWKNY